MSIQPEDTNNTEPVTASADVVAAHADVVAAQSDAENDITASPSNDSPATPVEAKPKPKSFLQKFPFRFKGRNNVIVAGSNPPSGITKAGGSSVTKPPDPNLPKPG